PKAGSRALTAVVPPTAGIKKILSKLADLPQEAEKEAKTVEDFKRQNVELKRQNDLLKKAPGTSDPKVIQQAIEREVERAVKEVEQQKEREFHNERMDWERYNKEWQS